MMLKTLEELIELIRERKKALMKSSYTKKLLHDKNLSLEKVKEEVGELIEAVDKNTNTVHEAADVLYHLMVYLEANNINIEDVMAELENVRNNFINLILFATNLIKLGLLRIA